MVTTKGWIKFFIIIIIVIIGISYLYNNISLSNKLDNTTVESKKTISKHILTQSEIKNIKNNFSKIDNNFSNRIIHTKNGMIIERIK